MNKAKLLTEIEERRKSGAKPRTFIMQLSSFDTSHTGAAVGTPEVLIPLDAQSYFPPLSMSSKRKYPDVYFSVSLDTPTGPETHRYRLWYYGTRAVGTQINECRLRLDHRTVELTTGSGNLLVINKLPDGSIPPYEATILLPADPFFKKFLSHCTRLAGTMRTKRYGIV